MAHPDAPLRSAEDAAWSSGLAGVDCEWVAKLAKSLIEVDMVALSLPGGSKQWLNGRPGIHVQAPRAQAFYDDAIASRSVLSVADATFDPRLAGLAEVAGPPHLRAFAAAPLFTRGGPQPGALCVARTSSRAFTEEERRIVIELAAITVIQVELRLALSVRDQAGPRPDRTRFMEAVEALARAPGGFYACILIDFADAGYIRAATRAVGHEPLERSVRAVAAMVEAALPSECAVFAVDMAQLAVLAPVPSADAWQPVVERLVALIQAESATRQFPFLYDATIGVAPFTPGQHSPADLLRMAGIASASASAISGGWALHDIASDRAHQRAFQLITDLHPALRDEPGQLVLHYQPRIDLKTGACVGAEALLRWSHPTLGAIEPSEFIPLAERSSLPRALTEWVMEHAIGQLARWQEEGLRLHLAVNISAMNLEEPDFAQRTAARLHRYRVPATLLTLEFTETALLTEAAYDTGQLAVLAASGITLAIDDFGTGHGNLTYLQRVPAKVLKIDRSFIQPMLESPRDQVIVRSTITMAHEIGYRVVAEGVESEAVRDLLCGWGCDEAQGFLFGKPWPATVFREFLRGAAATPDA